MTDDEVRMRAEEFARRHKKRIARERTAVSVFHPDEYPVTVFMAGSPGAGKTESSERLIDHLQESSGSSILRIDTDDLRELLPGYTGENSSLFQAATSIIADKMQDLALAQHQSYVFDGTLTNLEAARRNIQRNISKNRHVFIVYVYQEPLQAWNLVQARKRKDGRDIPKDAFIKQYFLARENVNTLKKEFRKDIILNN